MLLLHGDCIEEMKKISDDSVDMVLADIPYGITSCNWDTVIPFDSMWEQLHRVAKDNGAICLFGSEPFSSALRMSNIKNYKYDWVWKKNKSVGFLNAKKQPLRCVENICVFYRKSCIYNPQKTKNHKPVNRYTKHTSDGDIFNKTKLVSGGGQTERYPTNIIDKISVINNLGSGYDGPKLHPTQKPIALMEYLIKTYTKQGETVLDFTCGSGSTLVACKNLNRVGIGIDNGFCNRDKVINGVQIKGLSWIDVTKLRLEYENGN